MNADLLRWNLVFAWGWILLGFISGMLLGLCFHRTDWLGGYSSWPRRMLRLGHISFFGLGVTNLCFFVTACSLEVLPASLNIASIAFLIGGVTMPLCCALTAFVPRARHSFAVPVVSLLVAGAATFWSLL
ncbi:MAG TPA: hypothetical protein VFD27_09235 [Chthoniobacteraceae bacterium]|jgi:hypothetical protein|nr:hypothetical protein [Chthoniobacteraceae bacterium]